MLDQVAMLAVALGRFTGEGMLWALALPVHEAMRWYNRMARDIAARGPDRMEAITAVIMGHEQIMRAMVARRR